MDKIFEKNGVRFESKYIDFPEYLTRVSAFKAANKQVRIGQAYFTVLNAYRPELADRLVNTNIDPYYDDQKVAAFLSAICERW